MYVNDDAQARVSPLISREYFWDSHMFCTLILDLLMLFLHLSHKASGYIQSIRTNAISNDVRYKTCLIFILIVIIIILIFIATSVGEFNLQRCINLCRLRTNSYWQDIYINMVANLCHFVFSWNSPGKAKGENTKACLFVVISTFGAKTRTHEIY